MSDSLRIMVNGPLVGDQPAGPAVHLKELMRAVLDVRPSIEFTTRMNSIRHGRSNALSASRIDDRVVPRTTRLPQRLVRATQASMKFPPERMLGGPYDAYHQFHTDADPAVPSERLLVTLHDTVALRWPEEEGAMYTGAARLLRRAAGVITVSEYSRSAICDAFGVSRDRVHVIHNGVRMVRFAKPYERPSHLVDGEYLLYMGGHTPRKNVRRLIEAFAVVRRQQGMRDLRLVLAGPVVQREAQLRSAVSGSIPPEALIFPGYVTDADAVALYRHAKAFVYPSLYEGFGLPVLEAMAAGTPVVTSNSTALAEIAGPAAELIDPLETESIADGIVRVIAEAEVDRRQRSRAGLHHAAAFSWEQAAVQTLSLYDELAGHIHG